MRRMRWIVLVACWGFACDDIRLGDDNPFNPFGMSRIAEIEGPAITVDGDLSDWGTGAPVAVDRSGDMDEDAPPGTDIVAVYVRHATPFLYVRIDLESFAGQTQDVVYSIGIDLDVNDNWDYVAYGSVDDGFSVKVWDLREVTCDASGLARKSEMERLGEPSNWDEKTASAQHEVYEMALPELQVFARYGFGLTVVLTILVALFSWRVYRSSPRYGWM